MEPFTDWEQIQHGHIVQLVVTESGARTTLVPLYFPGGLLSLVDLNGKLVAQDVVIDALIAARLLFPVDVMALAGE